jgi:hypothetical protein
MDTGTPVEWQMLGRIFTGVIVKPFVDSFRPKEPIYIIRSDSDDYLGKNPLFIVHQTWLTNLWLKEAKPFPL